MPKLSKRDAPILGDTEIREALSRTDDAASRALIAVLYLFGARISEVLSLTRADFMTDDKYLYVTLPVLKVGKQGVDFPRHLYVKRDNEFVTGISIFVGRIPKEQGEKKVFDFCRKTAWKKVKKVFPNAWPHLFRHLRATFFADKGDSENKLCGWFGWRRRDTARIYTKLSQKTIEGMGDEI